VAEATESFTLFESGQVRPVALSADKKLLFAVNTPDNRLEVFRVTRSGLVHRTSIPVGLEPVSVAVRTDNEVWVVNHLSDSVSIVELRGRSHAGRVVRTLQVGDEPRDIVFAGPNSSRAFITTAHRGQNIPFDPQLTTPGVGRADVWVFDGEALQNTLSDAPLTIISLFADTPRALTVSPDGSKVYAAAFHSGNRTTTVNFLQVPDGGEANGGLPDPRPAIGGVPAPEVGLIVKHNGTNWVDELGRSWNDKVMFSLPDKDVFVIDANATTPQQVAGAGGFFTGVGTILFNMAVNPVSGKVYVSNTEAFNEVRFEGGRTDTTISTVQGHLHESRITVLSSAGVAPRHLNKHIDYGTCCAPIPNAENAKSLAFPQDMVVTNDGATLYVSAFGSSKIGVFSTAALEANTFTPSTANQIQLTGGGPTGLALDEARDRMYVLTRFDNSISIIDTDTQEEIGHVPMHNPEPPAVVYGRRFFYDASMSSSHGDSACASCHIFGDFDSLAWDLGNPEGEVVNNPGPFVGGDSIIPPNFHPMKGPMTTQSLRGMANHGPMHWRGDRTGANDVSASAQPDTGTFDEFAAFMKFNPAFVGLLGRDTEIPTADMQAFTEFILGVTYPPNPIRNLNDSLTADQQAGRDFFFGPPSQLVVNMSCGDCHVTDRTANPSSRAPGFFGTDGKLAFAFSDQILKATHFRNQYQKVGMFGFAEIPQINPGDHQFMGDQVRGFGFTHDGGVDTIFRFLSASFFNEGTGNPTGIPVSATGNQLRRQLEAYLLAFDSNLKPIVGQQVTLTHNNGTTANARVNLMIAMANSGHCELVVKGQGRHDEAGYLYVGSGMFAQNREDAPLLADSVLRGVVASGREVLTYTCVPPGSGVRVALDRDGDGFYDGDEEDEGTNPADATSTP
jgi:DNA-binding beta-propeller fold protein YncE